MRFLPPLAACIIGIAAVSALKAQETRPAESRPAPPVQKDATHDEAKERLARAAKAQCDAPDAPEITSLEAKFDFVAYEYDARGKVQKKPGDIRQFWAMKKSADNKETFAYRRELKADVGDYGTSAIDFTDVCWKFDPKSTRQISMMTKEYASSRENLKLERRRATQMIRLFFLARLDSANPALKIVGRGEKVEFEIGEGEFSHVTTAIETTDADKNVLRLSIDDQSNFVVRAAITWAGGKTTDVYNFAHHQKTTIAGTTITAVLPAWIQYVENGRKSIEITANNMKGLVLNGADAAAMKKLFEFADD